MCDVFHLTIHSLIKEDHVRMHVYEGAQTQMMVGALAITLERYLRCSLDSGYQTYFSEPYTSTQIHLVRFVFFHKD